MLAEWLTKWLNQENQLWLSDMVSYLFLLKRWYVHGKSSTYARARPMFCAFLIAKMAWTRTWAFWDSHTHFSGHWWQCPAEEWGWPGNVSPPQASSRFPGSVSGPLCEWSASNHTFFLRVLLCASRVTYLNNWMLEDLTSTFPYFNESIFTFHWGLRLVNVTAFHLWIYYCLFFFLPPTPRFKPNS